MITKETHPEVFAKNDAHWKKARAEQAEKEAKKSKDSNKPSSIKDILDK